MVRIASLIALSMTSLTAMAADCNNQGADERQHCEFLRDSSSNLKSAHADALRVTGNNDAMKSVDELFDLQMKNCNNYKCKSDVSAMYYGVISGIPKAKIIKGGKKLSLDEACDATTKMRYFSALAAYSPTSSAQIYERQALEFGREVQIYDISPFIKAYLSHVSNDFKQAYLEGDAPFQSMFTSMFSRCMSKPYEQLPSITSLVRNDMIDMGPLINVYKKAVR